MASKRIVSLFALTVSLLVAVPSASPAAMINVDGTADETANNGTCSLRQAINAAVNNSNGGDAGCETGTASADIINVPAGTFTLSPNVSGSEDANATGDFDITTGAGGQILIIGAMDADQVPLTIIDAGNQDRVFDLLTDASNVVHVQLARLVLRNGNAGPGNTDGGAIRILDPNAYFSISTARVQDNDAGQYGGAISLDNGASGVNFHITQTEFSGNTAGDDGGAVYLDIPSPEIELFDTSSFIGNTSAGFGGAFYLGGTGGIQLVNSTVSGNSATQGAGGAGIGTGAGTIEVRFSTVAGNSTPTAGGGGGFHTDAPGEGVYFLSSILSGNTAAGVASNCAGVAGTFTTQSYNVESANTCSLNTAMPDFDLINSNPLLAPLAFNPGLDAALTTRTHGLYDGSPALNRVPRTMMADYCAAAEENDQRYVARPAAPTGLCDVGAFEGSVGPPPPPGGGGGGGATTMPAPPAKKKCKKAKPKSAAAAKKCKKKKK